MDKVLFADITVGEFIEYAAITLGIIILARIIAMFFRKNMTSEYTQPVRCECGWQGQISKFAGRCPKCNRPLGQQRASGKN